MFFYGSHWDWSGCLVAADGLHFIDGCPIDGLTFARLRAGIPVCVEQLVLLPCLAVVVWSTGIFRKH